MEYAWPYAVGSHRLSGPSTESPQSIEKTVALLKKHRWYNNQWLSRTPDIPTADVNQVIFMLAAKWSNDIRTKDKEQHRGPWHYIGWPFKPEREPASIQIREPEPVNILTALTENERIVKNGSDPEQKAIALAWLFHLVGDVHQPLHAIQLFTVEYPNGDKGGDEICVRPTESSPPMDLHRFWDGLVTSSSYLIRIRNEASELRSRKGFQRRYFTELAAIGFESWAKESFDIATKIAYQNGQIGTPRGLNKDCRQVPAAAVLFEGYVNSASRIADRRIVLAGYRLADLLKLFKL